MQLKPTPLRRIKEYMEITSSQAKYLRGLAHNLEPVVQVGQKGFTDTLVKSVNDNLTAHELIKVRFVDFKEKEQKLEITAKITKATGSALAGMIGHVAILYRPHPEPEKRKIKLAPKK